MLTMVQVQECINGCHSKESDAILIEDPERHHQASLWIQQQMHAVNEDINEILDELRTL